MTTNSDSADENPFAAPQSMGYAGDIDSRPAALIRQQYLAHEASVQSVGSLYILGCLLTLVAGGFLTFMVLSNSAQNSSDGWGLLLLGLGFAQGFIGFGLNKLKSWARISAALFAGVGLLAFPIGTLINGYILYLLLSAKGKMVFSDEYREIIEQTPEIKYKTSKVLWFFLFLLLGLIGLGIVVALFAG
jgi:hypothetical protein